MTRENQENGKLCFTQLRLSMILDSQSALKTLLRYFELSFIPIKVSEYLEAFCVIEFYSFYAMKRVGTSHVI